MKIRTGFVSNSSSSSFVTKHFNKHGAFEATGHGEVDAVVGIGFLAKYSGDCWDIKSQNFSVRSDGYSDDMGFVRSFVFMKPEQTLAQFMEETKCAFDHEFAPACSDVTGPFILALGYVGNGG